MAFGVPPHPGWNTPAGVSSPTKLDWKAQGYAVQQSWTGKPRGYPVQAWTGKPLRGCSSVRAFQVGALFTII